jgi:Domain of Unknown Function (DUF1521)
MIGGVGASLQSRMALEPVEDLAASNTTVYAKPVISGSGGFKITQQAAGRVDFDLNDGYSMWIDESKSAVTITNAAGRETVHVWGVAQLALDGTVLGGFAGTTSLLLGNGTKITMETLRETQAANIYYLDRLTVTQGERAVIVSGVSQMTGGDLTVMQSQTGWAVDDGARDGLVFEQVAPDAKPIAPPPLGLAPTPGPASPETNTLIGWADEYGVTVTPEMLAVTLPGGAFGPGSELMSVDEFRALITRFLSWGAISSLMSLSSQSVGSDMRRQDPSDVARAADVRRAWARYADETAAATRAEIRGGERRMLEFSS